MSIKGVPSAGRKALGIIQRIRVAQSSEARTALCDELTILLTDSDFREWKLDPSKRKKSASLKKSKVGKKSSKKSATR